MAGDESFKKGVDESEREQRERLGDAGLCVVARCAQAIGARSKHALAAFDDAKLCERPVNIEHKLRNDVLNNAIHPLSSAQLARCLLAELDALREPLVPLCLYPKVQSACHASNATSRRRVLAHMLGQMPSDRVLALSCVLPPLESLAMTEHSLKLAARALAPRLARKSEEIESSYSELLCRLLIRWHYQLIPKWARSLSPTLTRAPSTTSPSKRLPAPSHAAEDNATSATSVMSADASVLEQDGTSASSTDIGDALTNTSHHTAACDADEQTFGADLPSTSSADAEQHKRSDRLEWRSDSNCIEDMSIRNEVADTEHALEIKYESSEPATIAELVANRDSDLGDTSFNADSEDARCADDDNRSQQQRKKDEGDLANIFTAAFKEWRRRARERTSLIDAAEQFLNYQSKRILRHWHRAVFSLQHEMFPVLKAKTESVALHTVLQRWLQMKLASKDKQISLRYVNTRFLLWRMLQMSQLIRRNRARCEAIKHILRRDALADWRKLDKHSGHKKHIMYRHAAKLQKKLLLRRLHKWRMVSVHMEQRREGARERVDKIVKIRCMRAIRQWLYARNWFVDCKLRILCFNFSIWRAVAYACRGKAVKQAMEQMEQEAPFPELAFRFSKQEASASDDDGNSVHSADDEDEIDTTLYSSAKVNANANAFSINGELHKTFEDGQTVAELQNSEAYSDGTGTNCVRLWQKSDECDYNEYAHREGGAAHGHDPDEVQQTDDVENSLAVASRAASRSPLIGGSPAIGVTPRSSLSPAEGINLAQAAEDGTAQTVNRECEAKEKDAISLSVPFASAMSQQEEKLPASGGKAWEPQDADSATRPSGFRKDLALANWRSIVRRWLAKHVEQAGTLSSHPLDEDPADEDDLDDDEAC